MYGADARVHIVPDLPEWGGVGRGVQSAQLVCLETVFSTAAKHFSAADGL